MIKKILQVSLLIGLITNTSFASSGKIEMPSGLSENQVVNLKRPSVKSTQGRLTNTQIQQYTKPESNGFTRIAVMLPLTGKSANTGLSLKKAAEIALFSTNNKNLILQFYDTNNSPTGIYGLGKTVISERADVIVGPLFGSDTKEISSLARSYDTPILSFSNDEIALDGSYVYSMNYLLSQEIDRIIGFAVSNGKKRIAFIIPDGDYERIMSDAIKKATSKYNGEIHTIAVYKKGDQGSIVEAIKKASDYEKRNKVANKVKDALKKQQTALQCDSDKVADDVKSDCENMAQLSKTFESVKAIGRMPFDAIFVYGDTKDMVSLGSYLMYYDVNPNSVKFLGTSNFDNRAIMTERAYANAWFTAKNTSNSQSFEYEYRNVFGENPSKLAMFMFDAISVISALSKDGKFYSSGLNSPSGFFGISGLFKFTRDGETYRSFDVKQIVPYQGYARTLSSAEKSFEEMDRNMQANIAKGQSTEASIIEAVDVNWVIENLGVIKLSDINKYVIE